MERGVYDFMKGLHSSSLLRFRLGMGFCMHAMGLAWCGCKISRFGWFVFVIVYLWRVSTLSVYGLAGLGSIFRLVGLLDGL